MQARLLNSTLQSNLVNSLTATAKWSHNIFKDCLSGLHWSVIWKCDFIAFLWSFTKQYLPTFTVLCILFAIVVKGIVHPKRKSLSTFTHTHVVPNLYDFLSSMELQRRYFEECWKSVATVYCLVPTFLSSSVISRRNQVWNKFTCYMVSWGVIFLVLKSFSSCFSDFFMEFSSPFPDTEMNTSPCVKWEWPVIRQ